MHQVRALQPLLSTLGGHYISWQALAAGAALITRAHEARDSMPHTCTMMGGDGGMIALSAACSQALRAFVGKVRGTQPVL